MNNESLTAELFAALDIVVMEQLVDGSFGIIGTVPDWFLHFYSDASSRREGLRPGSKFAFLENFLIDAEYYWTSGQLEPLKSGIWTEVDIVGNECNLEATALVLRSRKILLIELLGIAYDEKHYLIQKARENSLSYHNLIQEVQKKEILLHCIVHDLSSPLTGILTSLDLLERENLTPRSKKRLEICRLQCTRQEMLIRRMLDAFSAEIESLEAFTIDPALAPDALNCAREVIDSLMPTFSLNNMQLQLDPNMDVVKKWKVVGEKSRLERVLTNLVENAFRHSPHGSTVTISLQEDEEGIVISVEDEGSGVSPEVSQNLFKKFSQGKNKSGKAGLGLYFCRITIERWGGTIGYSRCSEGGSRFWFRLPKPSIERKDDR
ncbi:MAG TPA: ATPase [Cyanobacteria bacterium UBA8553]|nr:ATPase [Cyanobacteria bacterium UBA8553]HAJ59176.1 ATPase [Cyanobacteria bacterium UBA8543]